MSRLSIPTEMQWMAMRRVRFSFETSRRMSSGFVHFPEPGAPDVADLARGLEGLDAVWRLLGEVEARGAGSRGP